MSVDFVVVGHLLQDLVQKTHPHTPSDLQVDDWCLGGTAAYSAVLANRLGYNVGVVTSTSDVVLSHPALRDIAIHNIPTPVATRFRNTYSAAGRIQRVLSRAHRIDRADVPEKWSNAPIVLLGPVANEVDTNLATAFGKSRIGICAQGWLRRIDDNGHVFPVPAAHWDMTLLYRNGDAIFVSPEDLLTEESDKVVKRWSQKIPAVLYTKARDGAEIFLSEQHATIPAFRATEVDPTGAGDTFATAFMLAWHETGDPIFAMRFAACAASFIVEVKGVDNAPSRTQIDARLREQSDIVVLDSTGKANSGVAAITP